METERLMTSGSSFSLEAKTLGKEEVSSEGAYDMDGTANLQSVLQTNLPEPYEASQDGDLKEGIPEGLSDTVRERGARNQYSQFQVAACLVSCSW